MKKTTNNLILLCMIFGISLVIANVVTGKLIDTGLSLFGTTIVIPGAVLCYCLTYLCTDVVGEIWGADQANKCVKYGLVGQVLATSLIMLTQFLPAVDGNVQNAYSIILGQNWVFVIGSLIAYLISQTWDVFIFHKIRNKIISKQGNNNHRWIWNNVSTMTSQILDTVVFIGISYGLGFGWLFNPEMHATLFTMMIGQYLVKLSLALLDTPVFYLLTRGTD